MKNWKKVAMLCSTILASFTLAACSSSSETKESSSGPADITLWVDATQVEYYEPMVERFESKNEDITVTVKASPTGSQNAKIDVSKDPESAADVFELPHDQIGQMVEAGYINPLSPTAEETIKENDVTAAVTAVTYKDKMYAYPQSQESKIMFYNKSKLTEEDVKTFEGITAKATIAMTITDDKNGAQYTMIPFFLSNGVELYGSAGEDLTASTFNTEKGVNVMTWIAGLKTNDHVLDASTAAIDSLKSGKADAYLDGPWNSGAISEALGDNYAVATYPSADLGNGSVDLKAFSGVKGFAVNSGSKYQVASAKLAEFLTSKDEQLQAYKDEARIPVNKEALKDETIVADPVAQAVSAMSERNVMMPKLPEMAKFWDLATPVIVGSYNGTIKSVDFQATLDQFAEDISQESK
ncbi:MAG: extracellular solute-binding protein [Lactovum sp.]